MKKTLSTAVAVAVLSGSAMFATSSASQAHGYKHYGYSNYYYQPYCFYKKIKVWGYYGYHWKRIKVCR